MSEATVRNTLLFWCPSVHSCLCVYVDVRYVRELAFMCLWLLFTCVLSHDHRHRHTFIVRSHTHKVKDRKTYVCRTHTRTHKTYGIAWNLLYVLCVRVHVRVGILVESFMTECTQQTHRMMHLSSIHTDISLNRRDNVYGNVSVRWVLVSAMYAWYSDKAYQLIHVKTHIERWHFSSSANKPFLDIDLIEMKWLKVAVGGFFFSSFCYFSFDFLFLFSSIILLLLNLF